ncbi:universal stress protein [Peribacillus sp. NPDC096540]|uniref:universal stress protein n=1 Tax=Peribacillus sp. NPDC096540 TaxID=3390612 RepID=UPI003CFCC2AE
MEELKHIVVAYDGNEESKRAVEYGATLKKAFPKAELTVVHVLNDKVEQRIIGNASAPGLVPSAGFYVAPVQTHPVVEVEQSEHQKTNDTYSVFENSVQNAESNTLRLLSECQVKGKFEILEGHAPDSVCDYAAKTAADLIVVGNSAKSGLENSFLAVQVVPLRKTLPVRYLLQSKKEPAHSCALFGYSSKEAGFYKESSFFLIGFFQQHLRSSRIIASLPQVPIK